tara:strand:- start:1679 stop:1828 length:150 start_codon:yes stop_codon:yes gene_type:complete
MELYVITIKDAYGIQYSYERFLTKAQVESLEGDGVSVRPMSSFKSRVAL